MSVGFRDGGGISGDGGLIVGAADGDGDGIGGFSALRVGDFNVVSELKLFTDGEEVEGLVEVVGVGVEGPVESACVVAAIDDLGGIDGGDGGRGRPG